MKNLFRGASLFALLIGISEPAVAAIAIDGASNIGGGACGTVETLTLTTSQGSDLIEVAAVSRVNTGGLITVANVTGSGLTFSKRAAASGATTSYAYTDAEIWTATASAPLTNEVISVTYSTSAGECTSMAWGVSGGNTASPFDQNGSLPASAHSSSASATPSVGGVSTTNAQDMLVAITWNEFGNSPSPGSGYTSIGTPGGEIDAQYQVVSTPQSSVTVSFGAADAGKGFVMIADALVARKPQLMFLPSLPF